MKEYNKYEDKRPKVVVIGGGTGVSILLYGLKKFTSNITAIITVADDGGSSGILREDLGMLPPGDIRACLLALSNTEPKMEKLLQYRFEEGSLKGQNFGNIFIAAMNEIYGSFEKAIKETSNVLAVTGKVLPVTLDNVELCAVLENGETIVGESNIPGAKLRSGKKIDHIYMSPKISNPLSESLEAIREADLIVLGPGSLYTSLIPNLLVNDMVDSIYRARAPKIYIGNIMTQPGETDGYGLLDHVDGILKHSREDFLDYIIANDGEIPIDVKEKYIMDGSQLVKIKPDDEKNLAGKNIRLIKDDLVDIQKDYIRHDNIKISKILMEIANGDKI